MAEQTVYTDAVDLVDGVLSAHLLLEPDDLYHRVARAVVDALVTAGWAPRAEVAEHDARVRAEVRAEVAEEIGRHLVSVAGYEGGLWASVIARSHARECGEADHG
jgi:hypothetical protein